MLLQQFKIFQQFLEPSKSLQMPVKQSRTFNMFSKLSKNLTNVSKAVQILKISKCSLSTLKRIQKRLMRIAKTQTVGQLVLNQFPNLIKILCLPKTNF